MLREALLRHSRALKYSAISFRTPSSSFRFSAISSRLPAPTRARIISRWYSAATEAQKNDNDPEVSGDASTAESNTPKSDSDNLENPMQKELDAKNREIIDLKDKYLRSVAEYRNLQERTRREVQQAKDFAIQRFAKDLVESVDNLDLALSTVPAEKLTAENKDLQQLHGGLKMTESILIQTLKKHGLERFDPSENGDKFDPNLHDATFQTPQPDKEDGTVFHTTQKGFMLNGRVLRAAKVGVVKNS